MHPTIGATIHDGNAFGIITAKSAESYLISYGVRSAILHGDEFQVVDPASVAPASTRALLREAIVMALAVHAKRQDVELIRLWTDILEDHKGAAPQA